MNKKTLVSFAAAAILGLSVCSNSMNAYAAEESSQVLMLRRVFSTSVEAWSDILKENSKLLDKSFFERVESRIKWSIDNGQIEDAVRFAYVGDLAGQIVNHKTNYRMQMSQLFRRLGNFSMALDLINNVCILDPSNKEALFYKASLLQDGGHNIESYPIYEQLAKSDYNRPECLYRMALLDLESSDIEKAHDHLKECVKLNSKHEQAQKKLSQVERVLAKATFIPTDSNQASGIPAVTTGNLPIAASNSSKAMTLALEANAALKEGSFSKAKDLYARALELDSQSPEALKGSGIIAYREGRLEQAILSLRAASAKFINKNSDTERYLGSCYEFLFDTEHDRNSLVLAKEFYLKCQELDPSNKFVSDDLKRIEQKLSKN